MRKDSGNLMNIRGKGDITMVKNILWTGGWDSTYRLLDLSLNKQVTIQPYYIIDDTRASTDMEFKTMDQIIEMIKKFDKTAFQRIMERIDIRKEDIPKNSDITESYRRLSQQSRLGGQYEWLARYTDSLGINDLELSVHVGGTVEGFIKDDIELIQNEHDSFYILKDIPSYEDLNLFGYFHFPLLGMTKLDMQEQSIASGFNHIMEETWFCHIPINGQPCGMCNPCKQTRELGLGNRVPTPTFSMKVKHKWVQIKKRLK